MTARGAPGLDAAQSGRLARLGRPARRGAAASPAGFRASRPRASGSTSSNALDLNDPADRAAAATRDRARCASRRSGDRAAGGVTALARACSSRAAARGPALRVDADEAAHGAGAETGWASSSASTPVTRHRPPALVAGAVARPRRAVDRPTGLRLSLHPSAVMRTCVRVVRRAPLPLRLLVPGRRLAARGAGGGGAGARAHGAGADRPRHGLGLDGVRPGARSAGAAGDPRGGGRRSRRRRHAPVATPHAAGPRRDRLAQPLPAADARPRAHARHAVPGAREP